MLNYSRHVLLLLRRLSIMLLILFLCRVLFYAFNHGYFRDIGFGGFLRLSFIAIRFDLSSILLLNALFILLSLLPTPLLGKRPYQTFLFWLYLLTNTLAILANCSDLIYYRYTLKRLSWDVFSMMGRKSDFLVLLPSFLKSYWYVFLLIGALISLMVWLYRKVSGAAVLPETRFLGWKKWLLSLLTFFFMIGLTVLGLRGGWQLIPISIAHAGEYTAAANIPLIIDSSFSLFRTTGQDQLSAASYFPEQELKQIYSPVQNPGGKPPAKPNIVIIILESFSKEYTGLGKRASFTPFLDSLMNQSYIFSNAIANGKRSAEGIPAILGGVPTLMDEPYNSSIYAGNQISSLPMLLKPLGYTSAFFHGGTNGTMNFQSFCGIAGFDYYFGRNEYNNESDFDGHWGIWDEPFLQYFLAKTNELKQPFLSSVFTLSSHDPYDVPEKYKNKFPPGKLEILPSIGYTDHSLREFFNKARNSAWFKNSIFVFTPDHTGISGDPFYANSVGQYSIPIFIYTPDGKLKGRDTTTMQQIDILPTLLGLIGYDKPCFSFGRNALDSTQIHFGLNFSNPYYQLYMGKYFLQFDGKKVTGFYDISKDSTLRNNLILQYPPKEKDMERLMKALIQTYSDAVINNRMILNRLK